MQIQERTCKENVYSTFQSFFPKISICKNIQLLCTSKLVQLLSKNFHFKCNQNFDDTSIINVNQTRMGLGPSAETRALKWFFALFPKPPNLLNCLFYC